MKFYTNREERSKWIANRFKNIFDESKTVLDVGCWKKDLKKYIPKHIKYTGIDIAGKPDIYFDLDSGKKLPFKNNSFDVVVCADILEHLEEIHFIFDELCRVSRKYIKIKIYGKNMDYILNFMDYSYINQKIDTGGSIVMMN